VSLNDRVRRALGDGAAETRPDANDPRFRGRTYAIPFESVWQAALSIVRQDLRGCSVRLTNDRDGIIIAQAVSRLPRRIDDFTISIVLDRDAQTRVDMRSVTRDGGRDLGANARRIGKFFDLLDERMAELPRNRPPAHPSADAGGASATGSGVVPPARTG
jgi:hypothetical protein